MGSQSPTVPAESQEAAIDRSYREYRAVWRVTAAYETKIVQSIDQWLLTLSGASIGLLAVAPGPGGAPVASSWFGAAAVIAFALCILGALSAKGAAYGIAKTDFRALKAAFAKDHIGWRDILIARPTSSTLDRIRETANVVAFLAFLAGSTFLTTILITSGTPRSPMAVSAKEPVRESDTSTPRPGDEDRPAAPGTSPGAR